MSYNFDEFEVGDTIKKGLARAKISNTGHLIKKCATQADRTEIDRVAGIGEDVLRKLAFAADMLRIEQLGPGSARLLQAAGVESLKVLRKQSVEPLLEKLRVTNDKARPFIVRRLPSKESLEAWIEAAKVLEAAVS
jgi:Domain of unknown function (DUF4332)